MPRFLRISQFIVVACILGSVQLGHATPLAALAQIRNANPIKDARFSPAGDRLLLRDIGRVMLYSWPQLELQWQASWIDTTIEGCWFLPGGEVLVQTRPFSVDDFTRSYSGDTLHRLGRDDGELLHSLKTDFQIRYLDLPAPGLVWLGGAALPGMEARAWLWRPEEGQTRDLYDPDAGTTIPPGLRGMFSAPGGRCKVALFDAAQLVLNIGEGTNRYLEAVISSDSGVSFSADGERFVALSVGEGLLFETASGRLLQRFSGEGGGVTAIALDPSGRYVATGHADHALRLWDGTSGALLQSATGHREALSALAFEPGTQDVRLLSAGADGVVRFWTNGAEGLATLPSVFSAEDDTPVVRGLLSSRHVSSSDVTALSASPRSGWLASGGADGSVRIWDAATGRLMRVLFPGAKILGLDIARDERTVLAESEQDVSLFAILSGERLWSYPRGQYEGHGAVLLGGRDVAAIADRGDVVLWETQHALEVGRLHGEAQEIKALAASREGDRVAAGYADGTLHVWGSDAGGLHRHWRHDGEVTAVALSDDGSWLASGDRQGGVCFWRTATGTLDHCAPARHQPDYLGGEAAEITALAFAPGRSEVAIARFMATDTLWDVENAAELQRFDDDTSATRALGMLGDRPVRANGDQLELLDVRGRDVRPLGVAAAWIADLAVSPDGRYLARSDIGSVRIWNLQTGKESRHLDDPGPAGGWGGRSGVSPAWFLPDGAEVVTGLFATGDLGVWDLAGGTLRRVLTSGCASVGTFALSPDGTRIASACAEGGIRLIDVAEGRELGSWPGASQAAGDLQFSPDGLLLMAGYELWGPADPLGVSVQMWRVADGEKVGELKGLWGGVRRVAFTPDGRQALLGGSGLHLWNLAATTPTWSRWDVTEISALQVTPGGDDLLLGTWDGEIEQRELKDGRLLQRRSAHFGQVRALVASADRRWWFSAAQDGVVRLWSFARDEAVAQFASLDGERNDWIVLDEEGRYDARDPGDVPGMSLLFPDEPLTPRPVEIYMREYYEPRLLARLLAGEVLPQVPDVAGLDRRQPQVAIRTIVPVDDDPSRATVTVEVARPEGARGKSEPEVHDLRLLRDGQLVACAPAAEGRIEFPVGESRREVVFRDIKLPTNDVRRVTFSAYAFNQDRVKSPSDHRVYEIPYGLEPRPRRAYLIHLGLNRYQNPAWDLRYAAHDAEVMAEILSSRLEGVAEDFGEIVSVLLLSDEAHGMQATKARVAEVLRRLAGKGADPGLLQGIPGAGQLQEANPEDVVIFTYSGHGYADAGGEFHLFPADIGPGSRRDVDAGLLARTIRGSELSSWMRDIDAGDFVLVIDACNSAASVEGAGFKPGPMGSRGFGQLAYDKGMRILTASQAEDVALESDLVRHGLLTYALVREGLEGFAADRLPQDARIDAREWLRYGVQRVPELHHEVEQGSFRADVASRGTVLHFSAGGRRPERKVQQPGLFDFLRSDSSLPLAARTQP